MIRQSIGLTTLYNRFNRFDTVAGDIRLLRKLHKQMDEAVRDAYGWQDLDLGHGFYLDDHPFSEELLTGLDAKERKKKLGEVRYTISPAARKEVLKRLLALNHERHRQELAAGLVELTDKGKVRATKKGKAWLKKRREAERKAQGGAGPRWKKLRSSSQASSRRKTRRSLEASDKAGQNAVSGSGNAPGPEMNWSCSDYMTISR